MKKKGAEEVEGQTGEHIESLPEIDTQALNIHIPITSQVNDGADEAVPSVKPLYPPILVTDGPLCPGRYYLVSREGFGMRILKKCKDGTLEPVDEVFFERLMNPRRKPANVT